MTKGASLVVHSSNNMKFVGFSILKKIVEKREMTLREVSRILPKKFNDHRDFYVLASLYTAGYIDCTLVREKANWDTSKNNLVAELFYTMTFGNGTFKYGDMAVTNDGDFNEEKIFCTAKGDLYFTEQRTKRVISLVIEFQKQHRVITIFGVILTVLAIWWTSVQLKDYYANVVYPDQIYLSLWETGKKVPINDFTSEIPPIMPIKPNEPVTLRFLLTQSNVNSPQITSILLTFPEDAKVEPIPYEGWSWVRNNDIANRYFLNFTTSQVLASGSDYNLPAFNVVFKSAGLLSFSYQIIGNKMKPISRQFIINTALKYEEELAKRQNYWMNEMNPNTPNTFDPIIASNHGTNAVSSSPVVEAPVASGPVVIGPISVTNLSTASPEIVNNNNNNNNNNNEQKR